MMRRSIFTTATFGITIFTIVAGTIAWFTLIAPELRGLRTVVDARNKTATELRDAQQKQALLGQATEQYASIQQDLERTTVAIPEGSNTGEFVAALEQVASDTGVTISAITSSVHVKVAPAKPKTTTSKTEKSNTKTDTKAAAPVKAKTLEEELLTKYSSTTFELRLTGSYETIRAFIDRLRTLDRFNILSTLSLSSAPDTGVITANATINIYHKEAAKAK